MMRISFRGAQLQRLGPRVQQYRPQSWTCCIRSKCSINIAVSQSYLENSLAQINLFSVLKNKGMFKMVSGHSLIESKTEPQSITVSNATKDQHPEILVPLPKQNLCQAETRTCFAIVHYSRKILEQASAYSTKQSINLVPKSQTKHIFSQNVFSVSTFKKTMKQNVSLNKVIEKNLFQGPTMVRIDPYSTFGPGSLFQLSLQS